VSLALENQIRGRKNCYYRSKPTTEAFPMTAIQVDGGPEFMAEFEQACADKKNPPLCAAAQIAKTQRCRRTL
jgi:hypothetical protein